MFETYRSTIPDIKYKVIYSSRRTIGISILPDSSVVVRVPYRTSDKTISRIVYEKAAWIIKHRDNFIQQEKSRLNRLHVNGETHLFRGRELKLSLVKTKKPYYLFDNEKVEIGVTDPGNMASVKRLLYKGYKTEAAAVFPEIMQQALLKHESKGFRPTGLVVRTMKRRWGSCSSRGLITLSTELIKLPDLFIEYVIIHELCHLKHHNHGTAYYKLLSELFPEWKQVRKELSGYIR